MDSPLAILVVVLVVLAFAAIFRKAGYSPWLALLMLVPVINLIWLLIFAFQSEWPIHRKRATARVIDEAVASPDEELALNEAVRLEQRGEWDQAVTIYERLAQLYPDHSIGQYSAESIERLRQRQSLSS